MSKLKLTEESFITLRGMLNSPDAESTKLGFEAINNLDFKLNVVYIIMLYKECQAEPLVWESLAPIIYKRINDIIDTKYNKPNLKQALTVIIVNDAPVEDLERFLNKYAENLAIMLMELGYKQIDNIKLTINTK